MILKQKIGIIGPEDLVDKSGEVSKKYQNIDAKKLFYQNEKETLAIVEKNEKKVDCFLFTGILPYYFVQQNNVTKKPCFYFPISGTSLYKVLFITKFHYKLDITNVSLDLLTLEEVKEVYKELDIPISDLFINEKGYMRFSFNQYVDFHYNLFKGGFTKGAITAINSVYQYLKIKGVPVFRILPTLYSMQETFKLISTFAEAETARNNQIIVKIIDINDFRINLSNDLSNYSKKEKRLMLYKKLLEHARKYHAIVFPIEENEFIILITKGIFKEYSNLYENIPLIHEIEEELSMVINMGIGMGRNAIEAEQNARQALKLSKKNNGLNAFIINQDKEVIGPICKNSMEYKLLTNDKKLVNLTELTNLSVSTLTHIESLIRKLGRDELSCRDLGFGLNVSLRTANRIMAKLLKKGVVSTVGYEQPVTRGRPRKIYKFNLDGKINNKENHTEI